MPWPRRPKLRGGAIGFRPTEDLRRKLVEAAERNGRTISREIEARLESSFNPKPKRMAKR